VCFYEYRVVFFLNNGAFSKTTIRCQTAARKLGRKAVTSPGVIGTSNSRCQDPIGVFQKFGNYFPSFMNLHSHLMSATWPHRKGRRG